MARFQRRAGDDRGSDSRCRLVGTKFTARRAKCMATHTIGAISDQHVVMSTTVHKSTSDKFAFLIAIRIIQTSINKNTGTMIKYMKSMQI
jgi:hypothetical protein